MQDTDSAGNIAQQNSHPERILILLDNPMEEHTVIGLVEAHGYNVEDEKELEKAIGILKTRAAGMGAHAVILMPGRDTKQPESEAREAGGKKVISGKAIRYKHFYY